MGRSVTFVSSLFPESVSDKEITRQSGILNLLEEWADVMADKGFLIEDLLKKVNATLVIPPFLGKSKGCNVSGGKQSSSQQQRFLTLKKLPDSGYMSREPYAGSRNTISLTEFSLLC